jgi:hypothetical protein
VGVQVSPSTQRPGPSSVAESVAGLAGLPAGPVLAAALADIDPASLDGFDAVLFMRACARQANHARGELFASVAQVLSRHDPHGPPAYARDAYGVFEVAAALTMSASAGGVISCEGVLPNVSRADVRASFDEFVRAGTPTLLRIAYLLTGNATTRRISCSQRWSRRPCAGVASTTPRRTCAAS